MKQKYTQIVSNGTISNSRLAVIEKEYNIIAAYQWRSQIVYVLKRKNWFERLINKIF